jgi:hypothetical protein
VRTDAVLGEGLDRPEHLVTRLGVLAVLERHLDDILGERPGERSGRDPF